MLRHFFAVILLNRIVCSHSASTIGRMDARILETLSPARHVDDAEGDMHIRKDYGQRETLRNSLRECKNHRRQL